MHINAFVVPLSLSKKMAEMRHWRFFVRFVRCFFFFLSYMVLLKIVHKFASSGHMCKKLQL